MEEHKLGNPFCFYHLEQNMKTQRFTVDKIDEIDSVEGFFNAYKQFPGIENFVNTNHWLSLFKSDIKPVWEDPANKNGIRVRFKMACTMDIGKWVKKLLEITISGQIEDRVKCANFNGFHVHYRSPFFLYEFWFGNGKGSEISRGMEELMQEQAKAVLDEGIEVKEMK